MAEADSFDPGVLSRLKLLQDKYAAMGQDLTSYLDGLLYADFPTYWDYINLDTLLSLQHPVTPFPDEEIFITYHQITELYFSIVCSHSRCALQPRVPRFQNVFAKCVFPGRPQQRS